MRKGDQQIGFPGTLYKDTKANIEALIGVPSGSMAYATDTNKHGSYNGTSWDWDKDAAGSDTQIQFNDGGVLAGDAGLTFNKTTGIVNIASGKTYNVNGSQHQHSLTSDVTGILPAANGGTGANNGAFVLTIPATGVAMLGTVTDGYIPRSNGGILTAGAIRDTGTLIGIGAAAVTNRGVFLAYTGAVGSTSYGLSISKTQAAGQISNAIHIAHALSDGTVGNSTFLIAPTLTASALATANQRIMNFTYVMDGSGGGAGIEGAFADMRYNQTSGTLSAAYGFRSRIRSQNAAAITNIIGHSSDVSVTGAGNVATYAAFSADAIFSHTGAGVITNSIGINIANQGDTKVTNAYGVKIANQVNATTLNYAIFTGTGLNQLGDQLKIDLVADKIGLIVQTHSTQTANVFEIQTSAAAIVNSMSLTAGTVLNEQGDAAIDLRAESDTEANMLFLDSSADIIYFGGNSITTAFSVKKAGVFYPVQATTAGAPAYVKGGMYFDTTLNKLRIGGATAWETVTSV